MIILSTPTWYYIEHQVTQNKLAPIMVHFGKVDTMPTCHINLRQQLDYEGCFNICFVFRDTQAHSYYHTHNSLCASCYLTWTKKEQIGKHLIATQREKWRGSQRLCMQTGHVLEWHSSKRLKYISWALAVFRPSLSRHSPLTTDGSSLKGDGLSLGGFTKSELCLLIVSFICMCCLC